MLPETLLAIAAACLLTAACADVPGQARLPRIEGIGLRETRIPSSVDAVEQPIIFGVPDPLPEGPLPLLVGLHTWSGEYRQMVEEYPRQAARRKWLVVLPHFRGPNLTTNPNARQAGGSILAQHDIVDAVNWMREQFPVDPRRIIIIGGSGGGHMTSLMCTKYPDLFAAGVAYCPITDMRAWQAQHNGYQQHIEAVCGGVPGDSPRVDFEYARRSPRTFITNAAHCNLLLAHGDKDATIWPEQTWETFRGLKDLPDHKVLFESWSAGHVGKTSEGLDWAATKVRCDTPPARLDIVTDEEKPYFWLTLGPAADLTFARCTAVLTRGGQVVAKDTLAPETVLRLQVADAALVRVSLDALGLTAPANLPENLALEGSDLVAHPGPGQHLFTIRFGDTQAE